jgi:hypothetical protein
MTKNLPSPMFVDVIIITITIIVIIIAIEQCSPKLKKKKIFENVAKFTRFFEFMFVIFGEIIFKLLFIVSASSTMTNLKK